MKLVFLDVDGVLLDYDRELFRFMAEQGHEVPGWRDRPEYYLSDWMPEKWPKTLERDMVNRFGLSGGMARLQHYGRNGDISKLLQQDGTYILSVFPEAFREDRIQGLKENFGWVDPVRVLSAWNVPKIEVMAHVAKRKGLAVEDTLLVDDTIKHIEAAHMVGSGVLMMERPYNVTARHRFPTVNDETLAQKVMEFYGG